ncbi:MAG: HDOD domain-containing protein [Pseudomonadales bacterium]
MDDTLVRKLESATSLPSMPLVASKLIDLLDDKEASPEELADILSLDVALSARIVGISNSALFHRVSESQTVLQAVTTLGMDRSSAVALGFSLRSSILADSKSGIDYDLFWRRSLLVGTSAKFIAMTASKVNPERAFLIGLLQDIGVIALDKVDSDFYHALEPAAQRDHLQLMDYENTRLGTDHCEVGAWLLSHWQLPNDIVNAVHHSDQSVHVKEYAAVEYGPTLAVAIEFADLLLPADRERSLANVNFGLQRHWQIDDSWHVTHAEKLSSVLAEVEQIFEQMLTDDSDLGDLLEAAESLRKERSIE